MSKKLTGNGFWESSRMMLPEHKTALIEWRREERKRSKPNIDFEAAEEIETAIREAFENKEPITIEVFNEYAERIETGIIEKVDRYAGKIKLDGVWIMFGDIIAVK
ncbi:YolD-like protein [Paenibacillus cellulosilyticus]|uniref:YolD-like protein n=1 Tax=Paenibacillus cellulosilyticus TaxID=375489 RepID=A0A2V2YGL5_9BACL|nr:YolD-like family protein [Paenibacillus cellulosilyticus]PWV90248.1 YolD-like protein [Paenibacillus cellulosilyticus]QKS43406.1 YolD-like family protein [Paenibacillus cellulosilyticus]